MLSWIINVFKLSLKEFRYQYVLILYGYLQGMLEETDMNINYQMKNKTRLFSLLVLVNLFLL